MFFILEHMKLSITRQEMTADLQREDKFFVQSLGRWWVFWLYETCVFWFWQSLMLHYFFWSYVSSGSSLLLWCSVLNLANSALLLRSGKRNSGEFGIYCPPLVLVCLVSPTAVVNQKQIAEKAPPPNPIICLVQVVSKNYGCILVIC